MQYRPDDFSVDEQEKLRVARFWVGEAGFEWMESASPDGPVAGWIEKNGEGITVRAVAVDKAVN